MKIQVRNLVITASQVGWGSIPKKENIARLNAIKRAIRRAQRCFQNYDLIIIDARYRLVGTNEIQPNRLYIVTQSHQSQKEFERLISRRIIATDIKKELSLKGYPAALAVECNISKLMEIIEGAAS